MQPSTYFNRTHSLFIDGDWRIASSSSQFAVVDPAQGASFAEIRAASAADVEEAAIAAKRAFSAWRRLPGEHRAHYLDGFAAGLRARKDALVALQMRNNGKPRSEANVDIEDAAAAFDYYAGVARDAEDEQGKPVSLADPALTGRTRFEPLGPAALIVPWNFPLVTSAWKMAPALAAGCTVVLKPSEFTPLAELVYGDIAQGVGLPPGVINIVSGAGDVGRALCDGSWFRKISFTGSNETGEQIMASAAMRSIPVSLELGGKSPIVVFGDADLDDAVELITAGIFFNCGQMCSATSRLIVEETILTELVDRLVARTERILVGPPSDDLAQMGPLTTRPQHEKVMGHFALARKDGIKCLTGGKAISGQSGFFVPPTIYLNPPFDHRVWRDEIFGPILSITSFGTEREAIELANDTEYGLAATIVSADVTRAERVANAVDAGHIWINSPQLIFPNTAWGGFKRSGIGRELGPWGLHAYQGVKHLTLRLQQSP